MRQWSIWSAIGRRSLLIATLALLVVTGAVGATAKQAHNPSCEDLGYEASFKIDDLAGPFDGSYFFDYGGHTKRVVVSNSTEFSFDWAANVHMDAVIVKAGPSSKIYTYDPEALGGAGLTGPENPGHAMPALSHVTFCFDVEQFCLLGHLRVATVVADEEPSVIAPAEASDGVAAPAPVASAATPAAPRDSLRSPTAVTEIEAVSVFDEPAPRLYVVSLSTDSYSDRGGADRGRERRAGSR